jgi:plastocyanin
MGKSALVAIVVLIIVVGGAVALNHNSKTNNNPAPATNNSTTSNSSSTQASSTGQVEIKNMMFTPSQITIQKGGTVTWTNNDTMTHTVTDDLNNVGGPASGEIQPGSTYSFTFNKTGSFQYHCTIHSSMRGTIVIK